MSSCKWPLILSLVLGLNAVRAGSVTNLDAARFFRFSFKLNDPVTYAVVSRTKTVSDTSNAARNTMNRNTTEVRFKMRLTAVATNEDGTMRIHYEPFDYEQDVEIASLQGKSTITTRGVNIVCKQNDFVTVDTTKDVGMAEAQNLKLAVYGVQLSGYFDLDYQGNITRYRGDLPFVDHWEQFQKYSYGLLRITFPTNAIEPHASWTNSFTLSKIGALALNGDTVTQTRVFSREPDLTYGSVASFSLYESENNKDLSAYVERGGQRMPIVVPETENSVNGSYNFDYKRGCLLDLKMTVKTKFTMKAMNQGNVTTTSSDSDIEETVKLINP